ncbi:AraC family transcriptional regulator [Methylobacterium sp. M6A4_1b]
MSETPTSEDFDPETPDSETPAAAIPCDRFRLPADPDRRAGSWEAHLASIYAVTVARDADLSAGIGLTTYNFGPVLLGSVSAPAQRLERNARMIARQGIDHVLLQFYTVGQSTVENGRRAAAVKPWQLVVFDMSQPAVTEAEAVCATNIMLPRALLADHIATIEGLHGQSLDYGGTPVRRLFHTFLSGLASCAEGLNAHEARHLALSAAHLCSACFRPDEGAARASDQLTSIAIRRFIEAELGSEALDAPAILARFGLSRSNLYRLFEADGGVAAHIRERRLLRAMRLLTAPGGKPRVSSVA